MKFLLKPVLIIGITTLFYSSCMNNPESDSKRKPISDSTPSKSMYFDWININMFGGNEHKVISNLKFFKWLYEEYGMQLDIYLLDAGNIDNAPNCNACIQELKKAPQYGSIESDWFKTKYPHGLDSIVALARSFNCRIGLWIGPDGYGNNDSTAQERIDMLDKLTREYDIALLKLDQCCSDLKPENEKYFIKALKKCYTNVPDLIVLNHRITLSDSARKYTTTFLWEGAETYIDVSSCNALPSPHHRYTLTRGLPPNLERLTEDHGVCLSSYLDYWEDDLILQAFNRNLILAPQIYGNPWLLHDEEFPVLARIFNLHRKYNNILINGMQLPEEQYGPFCVSRGNEETRFLSLRNVSWETRTYTVNIDNSIGLAENKRYEARLYHPFEKIYGYFEYGDKIDIEVLPFRSCLLKISSATQEFGIIGCNYTILKDKDNKNWEIDLLGMPGDTSEIRLTGIFPPFQRAMIDGSDAGELLSEKSIRLQFEGKSPQSGYHQYIGSLYPTEIPVNSGKMLESIYFSSDNNCLEVRSLLRSGNTKISQVEQARNAFFKDEVFINIGAWDQFALDNNPSTSFKVRNYCGVKPGIMRINLKKKQKVDKIIMEGLNEGYKANGVLLSDDLLNWRIGYVKQSKNKIEIINLDGKPLQYVKINPSPLSVSEIHAFCENEELNLSDVSISNLFPENPSKNVKKAWKGTFTLEGISKNSYLSVAIEGNYGENNAFAIIESNNSMVYPFDRSPAFPFNNWEHVAHPQNGNYTYYFNLSKIRDKEEVNIYVLGTGEIDKIKTPEVWMCAYPIPFKKKKLILEM